MFALASGGAVDGLMRVNSAGGTPAPVKGAALQARWPQFLPDGRRFLFFAFGNNLNERGVYVGSVDGGAPIRLLTSESAAVYAPGGQLLVVRDRTLMAYPFDPAGAAITGDPVAVAQGVGSNIG